MQEAVQRLDPAHDAHQVVVAEGEHSVHEVVALALVAKGDLQAVGKEDEEIDRLPFPIFGVDRSSIYMLTLKLRVTTRPKRRERNSSTDLEFRTVMVHQFQKIDAYFGTK